MKYIQICKELPSISGHYGEGEVGVNYEGDAPKAPWAYQLTGKVFRNFADAKNWLRTEAKRLSGE